MARKIEVQIVGDSSSLHKALGDVSVRSKRLGSVLGTSLRAGSIAATAGIVGLGVAAKIGFDEMSDHLKAVAQTKAVLKSTGGVANVTAKHIDALAHSLSELSGQDDEVIQAGENMLLTFTQIRNRAGKNNDVFDQATKTVLDLSTAMGLDMKQAALQVGKALNDPERGYARLQRIGVAFTDTQVKLIKHFQETGQTAKAQKVILGELNKEFGGSAKAAGDTLPGQLSKLKETLKNVAGEIVGTFLPPFTRFVQFIAPLMIGGMRLIGKVVQHLVQPFQNLADKAGHSGSRVGNVFQHLVGFFRGTVVPIVQRLRGVFVQSMQNIGKVVQQNGPAIRRIFDRVGGAIKAIAQVAFPILKFALTKVLPQIIGIAIKALDHLTKGIQTVIRWIKRVGNTSGFQDVVSDIQTMISWILSAISQVQSLIRWINRIPSVNTSLLDIAGINPNKGLLTQATGTNYAKGGLTLVGERGPELVGMPRGASVWPAGETRNMLGRRGGGQPVVVHSYLVVDGRVLAESVQKHDKTYRRQNGRGLFA